MGDDGGFAFAAHTLSADMSTKLSAADALKRDAGYRAVDDHVTSGMAVGLGTGSTAYFAVERVGLKLKSGELKDIVAVPTSERTREQAESLGIPLVSLDDRDKLDVAIDGADALERGTLHLIKGGGGAMHREKIVELRADKFVTIVDESKLTDKLGPSFPLPVEVTPFCYKSTLRSVAALPACKGCEPRMRLGSAANIKVDGDELAVTDNGNYIIDLYFKEPIADVLAAAQQIKATIGVVDHGLFCSMAAEAIVAGKGGVYVLHPESPARVGSRVDLEVLSARLAGAGETAAAPPEPMKRGKKRANDGA